MDTILSKIESIERCIKRVLEEYENNTDNLKNYTKQDAIVLNLQRACELSIDLANYLISQFKLEIPKTSRESFDILKKHSIITSHLSERLKKIVGFRNLAIHQYEELDIEIIEAIILNHLNDFEEFYKTILKYLKNHQLGD